MPPIQMTLSASTARAIHFWKWRKAWSVSAAE